MTGMTGIYSAQGNCNILTTPLMCSA